MMSLNEKTHIGEVVLNVENLKDMKQFYQTIIGMDIKTETSSAVSFGAKEDETILLTLQSVPAGDVDVRSTGLYHLALLLPTRQDLGEMLYHILVSGYPLTGASDHGYSEALYLDDPEGNGIEIYWDKPKTDWDIRADGQIAGVTEPMDAEGVIAEAKKAFSGLPVGSFMGHVHLFVADLDRTEAFYKNLVGFDLKFDFGAQAKFFAAGEYHHQIGANTWAGKGIPAAEKGTRGLAYYTIVVPVKEDFTRIQATLDEQQYAYQLDEAANVLSLEDPNGITLKIVQG
ncbi:Glyoxalase family protein [Carnobacterium antarcticum]|nr:Glyoxalase family protein [Carnobacterium sp. CP1]